MAFTVTWAPNIGPSLILNSANFPIDEEYDPDLEFDDPSIPKFQGPGEWPSFGYPRVLRVTCSGHILGASKSDFWANRQAFLNALTPPNAELTSRRHGILTIDDDDMAEPAFGHCRIVHRQAKLESLSPERCPYLVTFKAFAPHFTGLNSGSDIVIG